ncbi:TPA: peroxiredoxin family protein [Neisseria subflava]|jgi:thioredoxin family protein|uniref:peroxiredoxin family protein n=1 Tax=unclassified Neisseria TaxID=2623750 RepID=UPI0008A858C8|nr:TlpA disulfide reductase family protein [Neisseria sp. HMSC056A04]OHO83033.1 thioredoxin [Neisseria sp. HMSC056A04]
MKKILTLLVVATIGALLAFVLIPSNKTVPDFALPDLQGKTITNADLKDKVTLINFWFPSCPGCVSEMPKIIKTAQDYQSKNFQVLGIAQPIDPIESVHQYVKDYGLPFTVMYDADKTAAKAFGTQVYPTSVLIDKNGNILKTYVGEPNFSQLYQEIDQALAQ